MAPRTPTSPDEAARCWPGGADAVHGATRRAAVALGAIAVIALLAAAAAAVPEDGDPIAALAIVVWWGGLVALPTFVRAVRVRRLLRAPWHPGDPLAVPPAAAGHTFDDQPARPVWDRARELATGWTGGEPSADVDWSCRPAVLVHVPPGARRASVFVLDGRGVGWVHRVRGADRFVDRAGRVASIEPRRRTGTRRWRCPHRFRLLFEEGQLLAVVIAFGEPSGTQTTALVMWSAAIRPQHVVELVIEGAARVDAPPVAPASTR